MAKIIGNNTGLRFKTTAHKNRANKRKIIAIIVFLLIVVTTASVITFFKERVEAPEETTVESEITLAPTNKMQKNATILVAGVTTSEEEIEFLFAVSMNTETGKFTVAGIAPPKKYDINKPSSLVTSVEKSNNIDIDRYIILNQKKFKQFVKYFGYYDVDIKTKIDYSSDEFSLNLLTGPQTLSGAKFFDYIRFTSMFSSDSELLQEAEIIADYISQNFDEDMTLGGDTLFSNLANSCVTDISITDYTRYSSFLLDVSKKDIDISAVNISELVLEKD